MLGSAAGARITRQRRAGRRLGLAAWRPRVPAGLQRTRAARVTAIVDSDHEREKARAFRRTVSLRFALLNGCAEPLPTHPQLVGSKHLTLLLRIMTAAREQATTVPAAPTAPTPQVFYQADWQEHRSIARYFRDVYGIDGAHELPEHPALGARAGACA